MKKHKLTDFGIAVKTKLLYMDMTQTQLEKAVSEATGLYVDCSYMNKILTGRRSPEKVVQAIREILDIPETIDVGVGALSPFPKGG